MKSDFLTGQTQHMYIDVQYAQQLSCWSLYSSTSSTTSLALVANFIVIMEEEWVS